MKYKALISFSGAITASLNSIIEISNEEIAADLLQAGYVEPVEEAAQEEAAQVVEKAKTPKKAAKKKEVKPVEEAVETNTEE